MSLLLNPTAAKYGIVSSSPSPWEQNVALGIKLFNYSVSYRLANLTLSHLAPWTHWRYVCPHSRVCAACVGPGVYHLCSLATCERSLWINCILRKRLHPPRQLPLGFHACSCLSDSRHLLSFSPWTWII